MLLDRGLTPGLTALIQNVLLTGDRGLTPVTDHPHTLKLVQKMLLGRGLMP